MMIATPNSPALVPGLYTYVSVNGGTPPYTFSVAPGGAGGTINASTGLYTAPAVLNDDPHYTGFSDTIIVTDSLAAQAQASILVGIAPMLVCDIIQSEMGLAPGQVYLWDQKINIPTDSKIYIAIGIISSKVFGNSIKPDPTLGWSNPIQTINMYSLLSINALSRGPEARDRKEEIVMALKSIYSQSQQEINGFHIASIPSGFQNISEIDGAAIPYRFNISVGIQYMIKKTKAVPYYDTFSAVTIKTEP